MGDDASKQLVYSTVRIRCFNARMESSGTAFFMVHHYDGKKILVLVTNKHVVCEDDNKTILFNKCEFSLSCANGDAPLDSRTRVIKIENLSKRVVFHDDKNVDLCFIFINDLIIANNLITRVTNKGIGLYYVALDTSLILSDADSIKLNQIEDIVMIGYPIGLMDIANNKPIVRRGITATAYRLDYMGKKEFVIDAACFAGSSGSPVFLKHQFFGTEKKEDDIHFGMQTQYKLLGVLYAGPADTIEGGIIIKDIPCTATPFFQTQIMINLGYVIKPSRIMELFEKVKRLNIV